MKKSILKTTSTLAHIIKDSLALVIPVLFIGSFSVLFSSFPIAAYQSFLDSFMAGALRNIILTVQVTTVGILAVYITIALNFSYMNRTEAGQGLIYRLGSLMCCLNGFFIFVGIFTGDRDISLLSGQGVFSAMVAGIVGSALFGYFESLFTTRKMVFVDGADSKFNAALHVVLPFLCVSLCFATANYLITVCFQVQSVQHLFMKAVDAIFYRMHRSYSSGLLFTGLASLMWWFGIHGNNVLNQVAEDLFTTIIPGEIVSKSFIDTFVNMGGTGCTIGLLLSLLMFGKRGSSKKLASMALIPGVFNIGELLVFGFPIIYNPPMIIPFIVAPLLCFSNAFLMTKAGFMPMVSTSVEWTTPALMSGFLATGSIKGVMVQFANILISTACYAPFVIMQEKKSLDDFESSMNTLVEVFKKKEEQEEELNLIDMEGTMGRFAKHLAMELERALEGYAPGTLKDAALSGKAADSAKGITQSPLLIEYREQLDESGERIGAEALLRWEHQRYGVVYSPLVFEIARESGDIYQLETYMIERVVCGIEQLKEQFGERFSVSVDVSASTLYDKRLIPFLRDLADKNRLRSGNVFFNIREEHELVMTGRLKDRMEKIKALGFEFI